MKDIVFRPGFKKDWKKLEKKHYPKQELLDVIQILLVAIVSVFGWNVEGTQAPAQTVFDLPNETPGLQQNGDSVLHDGIQCIQVNINGNDIYFPRDGHQPTTSEAVEYSCANIDNRKKIPNSQKIVDDISKL